ncbi:DNA repair protein RadA [Marinicauda pacifica]|uniref:DNA repair protein RadA n=1 Tax=Marinicauda pacifica TaxID=1133559 RepID=A0A4S2HFL7_9PROT|nr:DNA repair protein RadA [Marinicauda pacifica]TGY94713.1 DNA repair protein RadA [Marinicauda pacifica]GGE38134.1 DNA repair protein RadA [Marinicauda pacifica]
MARSESVYVCQSCGDVHAKWAGRCDSCGSWNTLQEEASSEAPLSSQAGVRKRTTRRSRLELVDLGSATEDPARLQTGIAEFDRVVGGGLVPGSAILVGGDPGIGKSTLLLQAVARLAYAGAKAVYVSGEEAADQVRRRARRLGLSDAAVALAAETSLETVLDGLKAEQPDIVIIDSIQTLWSDQLAAAPGTVAQVRACSQELVRFAKKRNTAVILVGHVTKEGQIAGPRVVEHMVDTVLYFEGERAHQFRILRAVKNRFGPTDEIGVFEMADIGLREVANPSALFLDGRGEAASGAAVFAGMEGTRPVLTEIQALVAPAAFGTPRRAVVGWDNGRLAMVLAVLEARCGLGFGGRDVYLNVAGGLKISEPAADLAVAAALVSSHFDTPLPADGVVFGEIALSGDVRPVGRADARLKEAAKLGFKSALTPAGAEDSALRVTGFSTVQALVRHLDPDNQ